MKVVDNSQDPFKVFVRVRPLLEREQVIDVEGNNITKLGVLVENGFLYVSDPDYQDLYNRKEKIFAFNSVFKDKDDNKTIFNHVVNNKFNIFKKVKDLVDKVLLGINSTALAYGVTGTGKTHTMFGDIYNSINFEKGVCMYAVDYLFDKINLDNENKVTLVKLNYLEIYNEQVVDLLVENSNNLVIMEDPIKGVIVPDMTEYIVKDSNEIINLIMLGNSRRTMGSTGQNQFSSRSHAIIQINIEQKNKINGDCTISKLLLVDLAGSERGGNEKGIRREEGANINKSLLALGNCVNILSDRNNKKGIFVPYRDSKLTRLLKDSLGGNISTVMIACVSPSALYYDETINTLKYASRAQKIQKKVVKNLKEIGSSSHFKAMVDILNVEIMQLKDIIK